MGAGVQLCIGASIGEQRCDGSVVKARLDSTLEDEVIFLRQGGRTLMRGGSTAVAFVFFSFADCECLFYYLLYPCMLMEGILFGSIAIF